MTIKVAAALATLAMASPCVSGVCAASDVRDALAQGDVPAAERLLARMPRDDADTAELSWMVAHASRDPGRIARAAAAWCPKDPTGRACADAELFQGVKERPTVELTAEHDLPLSTSAPFPLLLATANGVQTGFIVDTGASQTVLSTQLAERIGVRPTGAAFPVATSGGVVSARLALLPALSMPGFAARHLPVLVMDLPELDAIGISGILSPQQAFQGLTVRIDLARHALRLRRGGIEASAPHGVVVPYVTNGFDLAIEARIGDGPVALFGVDTGMQGGYVVAADYHPSATTSALVLRGAGTSAVVPAVAARTVRIAGVELEPSGDCAVVPMQRGAGRPLSGMLGNGIWKSGTLTLDTVAQRIRIEVPGRTPPPAGLPN